MRHIDAEGVKGRTPGIGGIAVAMRRGGSGQMQSPARSEPEQDELHPGLLTLTM